MTENEREDPRGSCTCQLYDRGRDIAEGTIKEMIRSPGKNATYRHREVGLYVLGHRAVANGPVV